ncbi:CapA family protein [Kineococcus rhizosphaerae]|uniref:Poly-gamma-glutamate synthesis protein (Capsule biosynthesis protein) n=1 Tax=Kineococcus rhizosphaerae TaxID=559628 RepID=A0A2T0R179_9ACTN|nr:CapA family protein [Kineococcus rhizosphaerae]PRY13048.1 poly-gamma-glutamate synthesis protein (capsule biosynthesis protein) [Kineococcus rhizosphaerae]
MSPVRIALTGDLVVDRPDPDGFFDPAREFLRAADLTVGQLEVPHARTTTVATVDVPAPPADPAHLGAVRRAGFDVLTLAGNHIADAGGEGIAQTLAAAHEHGMRTTGAGGDLDAALVPALARVGGLTVGVLSFNCVGPTDSWATSRRPGAAYVRVLTHYEPVGANPGGPPSVHTWADAETLARMRETVRRVAATVDVLVVALHKGLVHTPVDLAAYETEVAHAAVDAGAAAVVGHHAHVARGIELHRGRPIFHGLGNFVTVTDALTPAAGDVAEQRRWALRRRRLFGFEPDPDLPSWYPFHPESRNTLIAVLDVHDDGRVVAGFVPCWIDRRARPVPWGGADDGRAVLEYLRRTTRAEGFATGFTVDGDVVRVGPGEPHQQNEQDEQHVPYERGATR